MQSREQNNIIIARFFPGEDFYEKLKELCQNHRVAGAITLSGIGQLEKVKVGFFKAKGDYQPTLLDGKLELLSLSGTILEQNNKYLFHLHAALADETKRVLGGHLIEAQVSVTLELVLLKTMLVFTRREEPETGLQGMFLE